MRTKFYYISELDGTPVATPRSDVDFKFTEVYRDDKSSPHLYFRSLMYLFLDYREIVNYIKRIKRKEKIYKNNYTKDEPLSREPKKKIKISSVVLDVDLKPETKYLQAAVQTIKNIKHKPKVLTHVELYEKERKAFNKLHARNVLVVFDFDGSKYREAVRLDEENKRKA